MLKLPSVIVTLLLFQLASYAQQDSRNSIEFSPQYSVGVFTANHKLNGSVYGAEAIYHINTEQNPSPWMRGLSLKSIDIAVNYKNMRNVKIEGDNRSGIFGDSYAILAGLNIALAKVGKTELLLAPAFGLGYAAETFFTNQNPLIGSHINFTSRVSLKVTTPISQSTQLAAGIDVLHYSNAAFRVPNNGMNAANLSLGVIQSLNTVKKTDNNYSVEPDYKKHSLDFGVNIGRRGVYQSKDSYFRTGLYAGYNYRPGAILGLSTGIDAVYYHSVFDPNNFSQTYQSFATSYDHWRVGAAIGPDLWMGKLALMVKYGYYLHYNSYRENNNTYWTAGMKYNMIDWLALQAKIYVHKTEADYVGFGFMFSPRL